MPNKAVKWTCLCGKVFTGKWKLYHHIENSHSMEALRNLEQDIKKDQCFYFDNKPIMEFVVCSTFYIYILFYTGS
jgi:hypothetical protein